MFRIALLCFFLLSAWQLKANPYDKLFFTPLTKSDGLSDNNVECIFKDSDGFIWFGTRSGLCRYDGYEIRVFRRSKDSTSISGNRILDITEDKQGFLWIGTYNNGLNKFDKKKEQFTRYTYAQGIGNRVNRIKVFTDSSIWICSTNGLAQYVPQNNAFNTYSTGMPGDSNLLSSFVYDVLETTKGEIYVAHEAKFLQKMNRKTGTFENINYKRAAGLMSNYRKRLVEDKDGIIWIAANYHGLCAYNPKDGSSEIFTAEKNYLSTNYLMGNMALDTQEKLWICTEGDGLNIFDIKTKTYQHIKHQSTTNGALNSDHTYSVYFDDDNMAWIGTFDKGVNKYDPYQIKFNESLFTSGDLKILEGRSVLDIFEDTAGRIWMGTDGFGLFRFESSKMPKQYIYHKEKTKHILSSNVITAFCDDKNGHLLIGTYAGGLIRLDAEKEQATFFMPNHETDKSISSSNVWDMVCSSNQTIWLGLLSTAVDVFNAESLEFRNVGPYSNNNNRIDFPNIMVLLEDSDGDIWFGSEGKGLYLFDKQTQKIQRIPADTNYSVSTEGIIKCLIQDQWGFIWIGTEDDGLYRFNKKKQILNRIGAETSWLTGPIQSLQEDNFGNIWIGTSNGLVKYNIGNQKFNHFVVDDGLSSNEFNADAMLKLRDGRILAGTKNGIDIIHAEKIQLNQTLPKIVFTRLTVLNTEVHPGEVINKRIIAKQSISYLKEIELGWKEKTVTLEFAALNYTLPQKCEYAYKLEGFDEHWVHTPANRRFASYSNLKPGHYVFKVKATNNDGRWGNNEASIRINVNPPLWNTLVFKLFAILLILAFAYALYRQRINMHKERFYQQQMEQQNKIIELEKEKLEAELKKLAFSVINKNKLLIEQKNKLLSLSNKARISVKEGLQKIVDSIDDDLDEEKDWKHIEPQIDKAYNQFITHLKARHPDLNATEIRIAAYIRMNLSTKEICEFMNKTQRAVENDRYRLRKKIGLESNDSIQGYFLNI
jgi:ligand-binding sensor domain-containing protein/DNA-binding CsgD family transcriptional regulator